MHRHAMLAKMTVLIVLGVLLPGSQCARDVRQGVVSGGIDFVEGTTVAVLETVFPIADIIAALFAGPP